MTSLSKRIKLSDGSNSETAKKVVELLRNGKIVALPTETVYGLACRADDERIVKKLYDIKKRDLAKPFTYVLDNPRKAINNYFAPLLPFGCRLVEKFWPGALTIVYNDKYYENKIGVRVPDNKFLQEVLSSVDFPVVLPSANLSGQKEIVSADLLQQEFGDKIDLIVENTDGGFTNIVSTVIDLTYYPFKILREAAIDQKQIIETFACKRIIFVCEGNTCRSPIAQMLFKKRLFSEKPYYAGRIEIFSRGISAFDGSAASRETVDLLAQHDNIVAYDFVSSRLQRYDILSADYIFVMQQSQQEYIISEEPAAEGKVFCLGQFLYDGYQDIPDPMGHGIDEYQDVYSLIKESVKELIDWF